MTDHRTELQRLLVSLCRTASRDGVCFSGIRVTQLIDAVRDEGRREAQASLTHAATRLDLASEFRVPLPDGLGGYGEVVVRRESAGSHRWAVTDGSLNGMCAWVDGTWAYVGDVGRDAAFCYDLDDALRDAEHVARRERDCIEASIRSEAGDAR